jgi:hypothetical protein
MAADVVGYSRLMGRDESVRWPLLATISSRIVAADLGERQRLHRRFARRPRAHANGPRQRPTSALHLQAISTQRQPNERDPTAARGTNSGSPPT